jgi:aldehyde:ferredoxin oxidoreductase
MVYLYSGPIIILNLENGEIEEIELDDDIIRKNIGGAKLNKYLYEKYKDYDPIIFGSGYLTGTLFPGASLGIITGENPVNNKISHSPFLLHGGAEFKLSGISFLALLGKSKKPIYLWLHDGIVDIKDAENLVGMDTWKVTDIIRKENGEPTIQVLSIGIGGEKGSCISNISLNYWGSGDRNGFGKVLGEKNVKAIAFKGLGEIEVANSQEFIDNCIDLRKEIINGAIKGKKGIEEFSPYLGFDGVKEWLSPYIHRHVSCYSCIYPCNTFVKYNEDAGVITQNGVDEPGIFLTDLSGLLAFKDMGLDPKEIFRYMEKALRFGIDLTSAAYIIKNSSINSLTESKDAKMVSWPIDREEVRLEEDFGVFSLYPPFRPIIGDFGINSAPNSIFRVWTERNALSYISGICPVLLLISPEITEGEILEAINLTSGLDLLMDDFKKVIKDLYES